MEVVFDWTVEFDGITQDNCKTADEAIKAAKKYWQQLCDDGEYEYGRGDGKIYVRDVDTDKIVLTADIVLYSEEGGDIADGRGERVYN